MAWRRQTGDKLLSEPIMTLSLGLDEEKDAVNVGGIWLIITTWLGVICKIVTSSGKFKCVFAQECANPISGLGHPVVAMVAGAIRNTNL